METNGQQKTGDVYKCSLSRRVPGPSCTKLNLGTLSPLHIVIYTCRGIITHYSARVITSQNVSLTSRLILGMWFWVKCNQAAFGVKSYRGDHYCDSFFPLFIYISTSVHACVTHLCEIVYVDAAVCGHCVFVWVLYSLQSLQAVDFANTG